MTPLEKKRGTDEELLFSHVIIALGSAWVLPSLVVPTSSKPQINNNPRSNLRGIFLAVANLCYGFSLPVVWKHSYAGLQGQDSRPEVRGLIYLGEAGAKSDG